MLFRSVVTTPLVRASGAHLEAVVRGELRGTFFTMDLDAARASLARVPWVRVVALRRQWPRRLEIEVSEHEPLARFVAVYGRTIGVLARAGTQVDRVDLRYRNGFAARMPGFREKTTRKAS